MKSPYVHGSVVEGVVGLLTVESGGARNAMTVSCFSELAHHPTALGSPSPTPVTRMRCSPRGERSACRSSGPTRVRWRARAGRSRGANGTSAGLALYAPRPGFWFLRGALTCTACRVYDQIPAGDHTIFLGEILFGEFDSRRKHGVAWLPRALRTVFCEVESIHDVGDHTLIIGRVIENVPNAARQSERPLMFSRISGVQSLFPGLSHVTS